MSGARARRRSRPPLSLAVQCLVLLFASVLVIRLGSRSHGSNICAYAKSRVNYCFQALRARPELRCPVGDVLLAEMEKHAYRHVATRLSKINTGLELLAVALLGEDGVGGGGGAANLQYVTGAQSDASVPQSFARGWVVRQSAHWAIGGDSETTIPPAHGEKREKHNLSANYSTSVMKAYGRQVGCVT
ncbi:hypothetical protein BJV74DRAFT_799462 [Russula compacta]|nr:hypothetical protein BJV74DRAFT_799462 [Russula compacta]